MENLQNVSAHYPYDEIPIFTVMPNHLHTVIVIDGDKMPMGNRRDAARRVYTTNNTRNVPTKWLAVTIGGIKSAVTKFAHENKLDFAWQTRFHDHIIRDAGEMNRIARYIEKNIAQWESDHYCE
ncbi:MAG: hypothetical protein PHD61_12125 [Bacteroidales bacterium]|nr:hypothetical protein [Lentimicrobiaceae bacterium]MDD5696036.1 hypothetical protein [Bacteroidales bacterium]